MSELPELRVKMDGEETELTWDNATLFTYREPEYNHIFVETGKEGNRVRGAFLFQIMHSEAYLQLSNAMAEHDYRHIHQPEVSEGDRKQWEQQVLGDLDEGVPEDWG